MNDGEVREARAIADELGFEITVQKTSVDGQFRLMVFDGIDAPQFIKSYPAFVERYGTLDEVRAQLAEVAAELAMDDATAARLAESMLVVAATFDGQEVAPISALPDTPTRVRYALQLAWDAESEPRRERALMEALVAIEAFVPDGLVPATGEAVSAEVLEIVGDDQVAAIVAITGVNGWRARDGVPARIGQADPAVRRAIASQAGYNASGVPAMFVGLVATAVVTVVAVAIAVVSSTSLLAVVAAALSGLAAAIASLSIGSRLATTHAAAASLDRSIPGGTRARRLMTIVELLPALASIAGAAVGFAIAAAVLG
jgi:hypothetical protein